MIVSAFFELLACLYYFCFLLLTGLTLFIAGQKSPRPHSILRRTFFLLALSLLLWQATLFLEVRVVLQPLQLLLGRLNFTAIVFAAYFALRFVQAVATRREASSSFLSHGLLTETLLLSVLTLVTPLISSVERVESGQAITTYGVLFPLYLIHILGCLIAALLTAFRERHRAHHKRVRKQLTLIGWGMLTTGGIALMTNAFLPYAFGNFRFCDVGALSTLCFVLAVAYAAFLHRLFDVKMLVRETLVYGILMAFVLGGYSATVFVVTQVLTDSADKLTQFAVLFFAFSFDPLRRWLEKKTDELLFEEKAGKTTIRDKHSRRSGSRQMLALLFPWRRP